MHFSRILLLLLLLLLRFLFTFHHHSLDLVIQRSRFNSPRDKIVRFSKRPFSWGQTRGLGSRDLCGKRGSAIRGRQASLKILREVYFVEFNNPSFFFLLLPFLFLSSDEEETKENYGGGKISVLLIARCKLELALSIIDWMWTRGIELDTSRS